MTLSGGDDDDDDEDDDVDGDDGEHKLLVTTFLNAFVWLVFEVVHHST